MKTRGVRRAEQRVFKIAGQLITGIGARQQSQFAIHSRFVAALQRCLQFVVIALRQSNVPLNLERHAVTQNQVTKSGLLELAPVELE